MREIKFRAWDGATMHLADPDDDSDFYVSSEGEVKYAHQGTGWDASCHHNNRSGWVLMQYTGLKDKNGVEIYEGDIVRVDESHRVIEWRKCGFYVSGTDASLNTIWFVAGEPMVIGNVHQHPELLATPATTTPTTDSTEADPLNNLEGK